MRNSSIHGCLWLGRFLLEDRFLGHPRTLQRVVAFSTTLLVLTKKLPNMQTPASIAARHSWFRNSSTGIHGSAVLVQLEGGNSGTVASLSGYLKETHQALLPVHTQSTSTLSPKMHCKYGNCFCCKPQNLLSTMATVCYDNINQMQARGVISRKKLFNQRARMLTPRKKCFFPCFLDNSAFISAGASWLNDPHLHWQDAHSISELHCWHTSQSMQFIEMY